MSSRTYIISNGEDYEEYTIHFVDVPDCISFDEMSRIVSLRFRNGFVMGHSEPVTWVSRASSQTLFEFTAPAYAQHCLGDAFEAIVDDWRHFDAFAPVPEDWAEINRLLIKAGDAQGWPSLNGGLLRAALIAKYGEPEED